MRKVPKALYRGNNYTGLRYRINHYRDPTEISYSPKGGMPNVSIETWGREAHYALISKECN